MKLLSLLLMTLAATFATAADDCLNGGDACAGSTKPCCGDLHCGPSSPQNSGTLICK
ncbi:uncharacterized protein APUU_30192S [Aspergillus puulaauensis]|uniref:Uncharacterized protein n=1 Tax=Aspergillus puulaauensis TaxID=1220207 RepID=A0A7R7XI61_9EURO|nr:uncharacterized protein APUU_30192S [Aspergillus puulaauensis]BCS21967.1 hypothetical protein APUU_30192S [Aspergillus puulaauensis]